MMPTIKSAAKNFVSSIAQYWKVIGAVIVLTVAIITAWHTATQTSSMSTKNLNNTTAGSRVRTQNLQAAAAQAKSKSATTTPPTDTKTQKALQPHTSNSHKTHKPGQTTHSTPDLTHLNPEHLSAESAIVWNRATKKVLFDKNINTEQPLASLTKLMTALVAQRHTTNLQTATTTIRKGHLRAYGDYILQKGQTWHIDDLLDFMLIESSNDAARAVASAFSTSSPDGYASNFIDWMNTTAKQLGLDSTYFFNPSGLDINKKLISGGYGTAKEVAVLFDYILTQYPTLLDATTRSTTTVETSGGATYAANNTNEIIDSLSHVVGSKTGYTTLAGGNLAMGFNLNQPVVIVVLGSTREGRFADMKTLYTATQKYFDTIQSDSTPTSTTKSSS